MTRLPETRRCVVCQEIKGIDDYLNYLQSKRRYYYTDTCFVCFGDTGLNPFSQASCRERRVVDSNNLRARQRGLACDLTLEQWLHLLEQSEGKCYYCHNFVGEKKLVFDHMIPIIKGGGTTLTNVVAACRKCNADKRGRTVEEWKQTHRTLRKIAAETGESLVEALERMANEEWRRLEQKADKKRTGR